MKKIIYKNYCITKLNNYLKNCYGCKYLITINHDIYGYADTLKEAYKIINESSSFLKGV